MDLQSRPWKVQAIEDDHASIVSRLQHSNCIAHGTVMMRRPAVNPLAVNAGKQLYRNNFPYAEDYDLWLRATDTCRFGAIGQSVLRYRRNLQQLSPTKIAQQVISTIGVQVANGRISLSGSLPNLPSSVDFAWLLRMGIEESFVNHQICRRLLSEARDSQRFGYTAQASKLIRAAFKFRPRTSKVTANLDFLYRVAKTIAVRPRSIAA